MMIPTSTDPIYLDESADRALTQDDLDHLAELEGTP